MRRARHLFPAIVDSANLQRAFHAAARGKRDRREVMRFEHDLEARLLAIRRDLEAGTYRWGDYRRFFVHDPKPRQIRAPRFRDRVVHHAIVDVLDPVIRRRLIADTYACIPGRGTHRAVARFRSFVRARGGTGWVLACDVRSYFASVDHGVLKRRLARVVGDRRLLALLEGLIDHGAERPGVGMPIGNLTSQMFANLYLDALDHHVKEELRVRHYVRYMDDFVLLAGCRDEARRWLEEIARFLGTELRLTLNPRRVALRPLGHAQDFLGYVHHRGGRVRVRRRSVMRLWTRIRILDDGLREGRIEWLQARSSLASWFGLAAHADAFRLSRAIFAARDVRGLGSRLLVRSVRCRDR